MKSPKSSRSRPKGRAGGRAGGAGYHLQDLYVAHQLAKLLMAGDRDPLVEVLWEKKALDLRADAGVEPVHVDDAIMRLTSGKCVYVQVKEASPSGGWSAKQLVRNSVAQQFWHQWTSKTPEDRPRTLLRLASRGDVTTLELMADVALRSRTPRELLSDEASVEIADEITTLAAALGLSTDSADLLAFLKCIQAEPLHTANDLEARIVLSLAQFREDAPDIAHRLINIVGRSKHAGRDARAAFSKEALIAALLEDGFAEEKMIAAGVVPAKPIDGAVWDWYRNWIVNNFRSFQVYGLQVDRAVFADLPALFVPLKLAPIPADRARDTDERRARAARSLADRLSEEVEQIFGHESELDDERLLHRRGALDLSTVLSGQRRFAIIGGPGVGKTTTLKWLAIASTLPGDEGRRLRLNFGLPSGPLIPV